MIANIHFLLSLCRHCQRKRADFTDGAPARASPLALPSSESECEWSGAQFPRSTDSTRTRITNVSCEGVEDAGPCFFSQLEHVMLAKQLHGKTERKQTAPNCACSRSLLNNTTDAYSLRHQPMCLTRSQNCVCENSFAYE